MICPICKQAEVELERGESWLGGWLAGPDVATCPHCGSVAEVVGDNLRYTFVPEAYAVFLGDALAGTVSPEGARENAGRARALIDREARLRRGELTPVEAGTELRPTETCIYTVPGAVLEEQRTRQGQPYWAAKESGPLSVTEDNLYVGDQGIPIRQINGAGLIGRAVHIDRRDRKRHNRILFGDTGTAYFAALAMARVVGVLDEPTIEKAPFKQKSSGVKLSIPVGKGKRKRVSLLAIPAVVAALALACPCVGMVFSGGGSASPAPTATVTSTRVLELADVEASATPEAAGEAAVVATATSEPTATRTATKTAAPSPTPRPTATAEPSPTVEPENCWDAAFVADVTVPDGTWVGPGESFEKIWRVRNAGECAWDDVNLVLDSGDDFGNQEIELPDLAPGETVDIAVPMTAPMNEGQARSVWQYSHAGQAFGTLTLVANVGQEPTSVPPTAAATAVPPTAAPTAVPPTATQPPEPTAAPAPTEAPTPAPAVVVISYVYYDGQVSRVESDEYAVIRNNGGSVVNLNGWRLNAGDPGQDFGFPGFELQPGQECRVYTNQVHPESGGFSFGSGKAIWNNKGDCGHLYDNTGAEVSTYCY